MAAASAPNIHIYIRRDIDFLAVLHTRGVFE